MPFLAKNGGCYLIVRTPKRADAKQIPTKEKRKTMGISYVLGVIFGILGVIAAVFAALYAIGIIKKGFSRSEGKAGATPIKKEALTSMLLKLNRNKKVFSISKAKDTDLHVEWKVVDAKWLEVLGEAWEKKTYKAWILLDDRTKTVKYNEMIVDKEISLGATGAHGEAVFFRGIQLWRKERGYMFGIRGDFTVGEIFNYKFAPSDIKDVVRQIANERGWAFELVVSKGQASYPKKGTP